MIKAASVAATEAPAGEAARAVLGSGGGAVDAVIAGFFAAAGARPDVLFAPAVALVAGFGGGGRVFDGRVAQPGKGAARPRGYVSAREIPLAAKVAAPRSIAMLLLLSSYRGKAGLAELARAGVATADAAGHKKRGKLIRRVGAGGLVAFRASDIQEPLLAAGGSMAGGLLTAADLEEAAPAEGDAKLSEIEGVRVLTLPEQDDLGEHRPKSSEVIVACDGRGAVVAFAYAPFGEDSIAVPELEVSLGGGAVPVRRGVTRVSPGTLLAAPFSLAVATFAGATLAMGLDRNKAELTAHDFGWLAMGTPFESSVNDLRQRSGAEAVAAVLTHGNTSRSTSSRASSSHS